MKTLKYRRIISLFLVLVLFIACAPNVFADSYNITVTTDGHGSAEYETEAEEGSFQSVIITPDEGFLFDSCEAEGIAEEQIDEETWELLNPDDITYSMAYSGWPLVAVWISEMPGNDISFDISFAEAVAVTYDANGGITGDLWEDSGWMYKDRPQDHAFAIFDDLVMPPEGKEYDGVEVNGVRVGPDDTFTFTEDSAVVYQWKDPETNGKTCEVVYDLNGGTQSDMWQGSRALEVGKEEEIRFLEELVNAPEGMMFDGIKVDGTVYGPHDSWIVPDMQTVTVRFLWTEAVKTCPFRFDINGGAKGEDWVSGGDMEVGSEEIVPETIDDLALPPEGMEYAGMNINGVDYAPGSEFVVPDADEVVVTVIWAKKAGDHKAGDVNGDGKVNTRDVVTLLKYITGEDVYVVPGSTNIDGDEQGKSNTRDVVRLLKYITGEDVEIF